MADSVWPWDSILNAAGTAASAYGSYKGQQSANRANLNIAQGINATNERIANSSNAFSAAQAKQQMDFQERMSNTSWQRGVADMRLAGINPMLAVSQGGAGSGSGASASASQIAAQTGASQQDAIGPAVSSAHQSLRLAADLKNLAEQNKLTQANIENTKANTALTKAGTPAAVAKGQVDESMYALGSQWIKYGKQQFNSAKAFTKSSLSKSRGRQAAAAKGWQDRRKQSRSASDMYRSLYPNVPFNARHYGGWLKQYNKTK